MSFWTYLLRCADGSYYTGHTDALERRVGQHEAGADPHCYTFDKLPVELAWSQEFPSRLEALEAERQIKGWSRKKKEALIASNWEALARHAKKDFSAKAASNTLEGDGPALRYAAGAATQGERREDIAPTDVRNDHTAPQPAIVLVRPQLGENIGKAARAMLNFGLTDLRLVAPRDGWPNPDAGPAAAGADIVLEQARVFNSLNDAIADCSEVYATTVRKRGVTKPVVTPEVAAQHIRQHPLQSGIIFGPERSGLETDDVAVARAIITVPINPEFGSLNLAQAVILCAYEWSKGAELASPPATDLDPPAPQAELDGFIDELDGMLADKNYFYPEDRAPATRRTLRNLLTKPGWNSLEVRTLRGVLSALKKPRRPR